MLLLCTDNALQVVPLSSLCAAGGVMHLWDIFCEDVATTDHRGPQNVNGEASRWYGGVRACARGGGLRWCASVCY
jgi:hypothetical protein